ncbi:aldolase/citrate lyase family protein [Lachnoclostridium edouardi]|uniref:aldolase/citrate lyase family protein n=1 Tax=Lachnoclostridium edouardi TaxID=1926283 RepID=UPI002F428169
MIKLMYITNQPEIAKIAESAGVDRIFVDLEYIGKSDRQGGMDTVQSHHTIEDVKRIKQVLLSSELLVRVNPIHEASSEYSSSKEEIDQAIDAGADILMLPFFKTVDEVRSFIEMVDGRAKVMPLLETPEAVEVVDDILELAGLDEILIGLNDLSLGYQKKFMFELLIDGTVEKLCQKFKEKGIPYGFGGIAAIGMGAIPAEMVLKEHYRLGSERVILSRSFCNSEKVQNLDIVKEKFELGIRALRAVENEVSFHSQYFTDNFEKMKLAIEDFISK